MCTQSSKTRQNKLPFTSVAVSEDMLIPVKIARQLNSGVYKNPMEELIAKAVSSNNYILLTVHREQAWTVVMRVCITISGIKEQ